MVVVKSHGGSSTTKPHHSGSSEPTSTGHGGGSTSSQSSSSSGHSEVSYSTMENFGTHLDGVSSKLTSASDKMGSLNFGPQTFGVVGQAFAGNSSSHVQQLAHGTSTAAQGTSKAADNTRTMLNNYKDTESGISSMFGKMHPSGSTGPTPHASSSGTSGGGKSGKGKGPAVNFTGTAPHSSGSGGGLGGAGGDDPKRPGGNGLGNSHANDSGSGGNKRKRPGDDSDNTPNKTGKTSPNSSPGSSQGTSGLPPRRSGRIAGGPSPFKNEADLQQHLAGNAGDPARPGGGGFFKPNGSSSSATLTGWQGKPVPVNNNSHLGPDVSGQLKPPKKFGDGGDDGSSQGSQHSGGSASGSGGGSSLPTGSEGHQYGQIGVHHEGVNPQHYPQAAPRPNAQGPTTGGHDGSPASHFVDQPTLNSMSGQQRPIGQNQVMGGSAADATAASGLPTYEGTTHDWMHGQAFSSGGEGHTPASAQTPHNLITAAPHGANMQHNAWEQANQNQGVGMHGVVSSSAQPVNPINSQNHVYGGVDYTTHDTYEPTIGHTEHIPTAGPGSTYVPHSADAGYAGAQTNVNGAMGIMHMLGSNGENLDDYHPGLQSATDDWGAAHHQGVDPYQHLQPGVETTQGPQAGGSQSSHPSFNGQLNDLNLNSQSGGAHSEYGDDVSMDES